MSLLKYCIKKSAPIQTVNTFYKLEVNGYDLGITSGIIHIMMFK